MPSSLIFAALAVAWLVVLVPMVAKRRQEVARTAESVLASRVLPRPHLHRAVRMHDQEVPMIGERIAETAMTERRYRPGRGGFDPEVAAQVARERYALRQRVVLGLVVGAVATLVLALVASSLLWWAQVMLDLAVIGYLGYLRRQVRIEEDVRQRRAARLTGSPASTPAPDVTHDEVAAASPTVDPQPAAPHPTAVALELDDEDPTFDELKPTFQPHYRRAAGE
ncbi:MAG: divisome protein SepX/GlpR [Pseudonocardiaceae bacterium]